MKDLTEKQVEGIFNWLIEYIEDDENTLEIASQFKQKFTAKDNKNTDEYWLQRANEKLKDIQQWSNMGLFKTDLTQRVYRSLFADINNRCSD